MHVHVSTVSIHKVVIVLITTCTVPLKKFATVGGAKAARKWWQNVGGCSWCLVASRRAASHWAASRQASHPMPAVICSLQYCANHRPLKLIYMYMNMWERGDIKHWMQQNTLKWENIKRQLQDIFCSCPRIIFPRYAFTLKPTSNHK